MRKKISHIAFLVWGTCCAVAFSAQVSADTRQLVSTSRVVAPTGTTAEKMWVKEIRVSDAGSYSLLIDEAENSASSPHLSAVLVAGENTVLRAENGVLSAPANLTTGVYTLYVSYEMPENAPWLTIKGSLYKDGIPVTTTLENFVQTSLPEGERVVQYRLDRESYPLEGGNLASFLLRDVSFDLTDQALASLHAQIIDSSGVVASLTGNSRTNFQFTEDASLLLHAKFSTEQEEAIIDVKVAEQSIEGEGLVSLERTYAPLEISESSTGQYKINVIKGSHLEITLRGVDLGEANDDLALLVTTLTPENTLRYSTADLYNRTLTHALVADNESLYIASVFHSGDMAVIVNVRNQAGETLFEQVLTGAHVINLGAFENPQKQELKAVLTDFNFPVRFNAIGVAALTSDLTQDISVLTTASNANQVNKTSSFNVGKYHLVAFADIDDGQNGTAALVVENSSSVLFESVNTLGQNPIPAESFTLASASNVNIRLTDHKFPKSIDQASVALLNRAGLVASGNSLVQQAVNSDRYYLAVAAKSSQHGIYHLAAEAVDTTPTGPDTAEAEPPRNVSGSGGKNGGGGSLGWELAILLLAFLTFGAKQNTRFRG